VAIIRLADDLKQPIHHALSLIPEVQTQELDIEKIKERFSELDDACQIAIRHISTTCRTLLKLNGFALVKGLSPFPDARALVSVALEIGTIFQDLSHQATTVLEAIPTIAPLVQGNQTEPLFMHTDFAMLETPPAVTMILCRHPDHFPGFGQNGIAIVQNIVSRIYGSQLLDDLHSVPLPFGGRTPGGQEIFLSLPILSAPSNDSKLTQVRFHPSRIHHGFRLIGESPRKEETRLLRHFQKLALENRFEVGLEQGDLLLLNNRCVLHDRTRCTIELGLQSVSSRHVHILFVQEIAD